MAFIKIVSTLALIAGALGKPIPWEFKIEYPTNVGCGEVDVFYTGFPAFHPLVAEQGYNTTAVDISLRNETANLVRAGYNVRILWQGPEQPIENQAERLEAQHWDVTAVGWGIRGAPTPVITTLFEDILHQFRKSAPKTPTVFNWSPTSLAFSVIRRIPLNEGCTDKPGTLIAYEEICDDRCEKTLNITSGSLEELLEGIE